jgi:hypothetical protein
MPSWSRRPATIAASAINRRLANGYRLPAGRRWSGTDASASQRLIVCVAAEAIRDSLQFSKGIRIAISPRRNPKNRDTAVLNAIESRSR